jgi:acetolactate synthase regulatory subunit
LPTLSNSMQQERVIFVIKAENRADLLARIVLLFHRLNVEIHALSMERKRASKTMRMNVTVEADRGGAFRLEAQLYKVVEVREVGIQFLIAEREEATFG